MPDEARQARVAHIVLMIAVNTGTGRIQSQNIIGIFDNEEDAKKLEGKFNAEEHRAEGVISKAFRHRYNIPFIAPAVRDLKD